MMRPWRALLWKEWREQRWRCALGTLVLATLSASLVRAQLVTLPEAAVMIFWPIGLLLAIFLAMGSVATERADGTWPFLRARPVGPAFILRIKWAAGAAYLAGALLIAAGAAHVAAWSRGLFDLPAPPPELAASMSAAVPLPNSPAWLWNLVFLALVALLAWYTVLFFLLTRARDELHAGIGGVLLTLACLAWLLQLFMASLGEGWLSAPVRGILWMSCLLNPLSPLALLEAPLGYRLLATAIALGVWIAGPVWLVGRLERAGRLS